MPARAHLRRRPTAALIAGLSALVGLAACSSGPRVVNMDASWAGSYRSVADLKAHSDLVVVGSFGQVLDRTRDGTGIPFTDFGLTVDRVLYARGGRAVAEGSALRIHQTGGVSAGVTYQIADDPLFRPGEAVVLFLTEYQPGRYRVTGGPAGRFEVDHGRVAPESGDGVAFTGDVDALAAQVGNS